VLARFDDADELLFGLTPGGGAPPDLGEPEDGVERGADLVAHVGQELAAGGGPALGREAGVGVELFDPAPLAQLQHHDVEQQEGHRAGGGQEDRRDRVGGDLALGDQRREGQRRALDALLDGGDRPVVGKGLQRRGEPGVAGAQPGEQGDDVGLLEERRWRGRHGLAGVGQHQGLGAQRLPPLAGRSMVASGCRRSGGRAVRP
jgi:hypothetical protein